MSSAQEKLATREIRMPALSPAMAGGRLAKWHVAEGQSISTGDVIAEIATPTATMEIEADADGRVLKILVPAGAAAVGANTPLALIVEIEGVAPGRAGVTEHGLSVPSLLDPGFAEILRSDPAQGGHAAPADAGAVEILSYRDALRAALAEEMQRDPSVLVLGPEVVQNSGAEKVCRALAEEFGRARVVATPPHDEAVAALAIGAALAGLRPVVEITSFSAALEAIPQILATASPAAFLSGGALSVPIVFRGPNGWHPGIGGIGSRCFASLFAQVPGLKVVAPATPADAKGLLKAAIRDPGPVVVLEHPMLYGETGEVSVAEDAVTEIGVARILRAGRDVTLVTYGGAVRAVREAADELARHGIESEIIDLRTLRPLDLGTVLASVSGTGRLVTVEEGAPQGSIGSEIVARISARAMDRLKAPPVTISGADMPMPYAEPLVRAACPDSAIVTAAVRALMSRT